MKTNAAISSTTHVPRHQHPIRSALGLIVLAGLITAVIVATTVEILGGAMTGTWPTGTTHLIAVLLAIPIGYAVAMTVAISELARGMDASFERIVTEMQGIRARATQAAEVQIASEDRHVAGQGIEDIPQVTKSAPPTGLMAGLMEGVEYERVETSVRALPHASQN